MCKSSQVILRMLLPMTFTTGMQRRVDGDCYVLGPMQGAFFIFHLLTKPFPSCDQPPIHLDHMTSHLTTHMTCHMPLQSPAPKSPAYHLILPHLTTHMTCHMPLQSPAPKSPAHHLILPHLTSHDPTPIHDSFPFTYLSLVSGFSARLLYFLIKPHFTTHTDSFLVTFTRKSVPQCMTPSFGL